MQKIIPHLWFDTQAKEAAEFYSTAFPNSKVTNVTVLHDTPSGDCDLVSFEVMGYSFMCMSAGPIFKTNPSMSFMVNFDPSQMDDATEALNTVWGKLIDGGKIMMPLDKYPFSEHYGWVEDKFGVSWQLMLTNPAGEQRPAIVPSIMFVGHNVGKAQEATDFYLSVFKDAKRGTIATYPAGMEPDKEGNLMYTDFTLEGQWFAAMDSAQNHQFNFTEGNSLMINCDTQEEMDYYWDKLTAVPESEQCGWLKDKYGLSWQICPTEMYKMMSEGTREQIDRVTQALMPMKRLDLAKLRDAFEGK